MEKYISKYRGKRKDTGEWIYGDLIHRRIWSQSVSVIRVSDSGFDVYEEYEVDPYTVGLSSGIPDKKGKDIFDGDICRSKSEPHLIVFEAGGFQVRQPGSTLQVPLSTYMRVVQGETEVVGNRWDDSSLLQDVVISTEVKI